MVNHYILNKQWMTFNLENHMEINQPILVEELNTHLKRTHIPSFLEEDKIIQDKTSNGEFSVKISYTSLVGLGKNQEWKQVQQPHFFPKINFFWWMVMHNSILMIDNLMRHHFQMCNRCSLCHKEEEFIPHLFIHYSH